MYILGLSAVVAFHMTFGKFLVTAIPPLILSSSLHFCPSSHLTLLVLVFFPLCVTVRLTGSSPKIAAYDKYAMNMNSELGWAGRPWWENEKSLWCRKRVWVQKHQYPDSINRDTSILIASTGTPILIVCDLSYVVSCNAFPGPEFRQEYWEQGEGKTKDSKSPAKPLSCLLHPILTTILHRRRHIMSCALSDSSENYYSYRCCGPILRA